MNTLLKTASFMTAISVIGGHSILGTSIDSLDASVEDILNGNTTQMLETRFDTALPLTDLGVNLWAMIRYVFFHAGEPGVVVGDAGWLFSSEEFYSPENATSNIESNFESIAAVSKELSRRGINLVVVPVPSKLRVHGSRSTTKPTLAHQEIYPRLLTFLQRHEVKHVDTLSSFQEVDGELFFKTDTHWLPEAATLAANQLKQFSISDSSEPQFVVGELRSSTLKGDLVNFLPLSPWFASLEPQAEQVLSWDIVSNAKEQDLFSDLPLPAVALVGTSYSANTKWNFEGALKLALNEDVLNFAKEGEGPMTPMFDFLDQYLPEIPDLRLVVWEIPERYLLQPYASRKMTRFEQLATNSATYGSQKL